MALEKVPSTFGTVGRQSLVGDVHVADVALPANLAIPPHRHERAQIAVIIEGGYLESAGSLHEMPRWLAPGSVVFRGPAVPHSNRVGPWRARVLLLDFASVGSESLREALSIRPAVYSFDLLLCELGKEIAGELVARDSPTAETIEPYVSLVVARSSSLLGQTLLKAGPAWFRRALAAAQAEDGRDLSVRMLASRVGVHPATLRAAFQEYSGTSTKAFLMALRLRRAARGLAHSEESVSQIALDCGFCDQAHLGRHFKRRYGVTPALYRRRQRGF